MRGSRISQSRERNTSLLKADANLFGKAASELGRRRPDLRTTVKEEGSVPRSSVPCPKGDNFQAPIKNRQYINDPEGKKETT